MSASTARAAHDAGTVLAFDFGEKRIGVATGSTLLGIAHPLETIAAEIKTQRFARIAALIAEWQPTELVVGLPFHLDGTEHELTRLARKFAQRLNGRFELPVHLVDERLSSVEAAERLRDQGIVGRKQKAHLDAAAAQSILQSFLDQRAHDQAA